MSDQFWLTKAQLKRIEPFSRGRVAFRAWTTVVWLADNRAPISPRRRAAPPGVAD
jgi:hypothetical protein